MSDDRIRLQKYMSECGVASRRKSEELIEKGAVKVNGVVAKIGDSVDPKRDIITLNGKKIEIYYASQASRLCHNYER